VDKLNFEISSFSGYAFEAQEAMRKIYEYLSVPASLKSFNTLDIAPLEIYSKHKEMKESFDAAIGLKNTYDGLRYH
jgi:hypothetical protein